MADLPITEEVAAGAEEFVVVQCRHHGNAGIPARIQHGRAEQRERVVQVDDIGTEPVERSGEAAARLRVPDHPGRQGRLGRCRPRIDLVAVPFEMLDVVAPFPQRC
jgi:hypothetical protein